MNHSKQVSNHNSESASSRRQFLRKILRTSIAVSVIQSLQIKKVYAQFFTTSFWKKRSSSAAIGGSIFSFGFNTNGELGDDSVIAKSSPVQIGALTNWLSVSAGRVQTTAIKTDGSLWSWGKSNYLGIGAVGTKSSPVQVGTATSWSRVSTGDSGAMAIKTDGTLWAWGQNWPNYQLSLPIAGTYISPTQVGTDTNWSKVSVGFYGGLGVKTNGTLWAWGINQKGRLGLKPAGFNQMWTPSGWSQLVIGETGGFAKQTDGTLWGWGDNVTGAIGDNTNIQKSSPVQIGTLTDWAQISRGFYHTVAVKTNGSLWTWGDNSWGQLGNGASGAGLSSPIQVGALTDWSIPAAGYSSSFATKTDGTIWSWGDNTYGQLGNNASGTNLSSPIQIGALTNWNKISAGNYHVLATKTDNSAWTWGKGGNGELGDGTTVNKSSPVQIGTLTDWIQISSSADHSAAIKTNGTIWVWGYNRYGKHGIGISSNKSSPTQIGTLTNWSIVHAGPFNTTALKTDGSIWAWGLNSSGELDNGTVLNKSSPVQIGTATFWSYITSTTSGVIALKNDSTVYGSGNYMNTHGTLYPYFIPSNAASVPIQVGSLTSWSDVCVSKMDCVSYALKTDGSLWGWGESSLCGLSIPTLGASHSPIQVGTATSWSKVSIFYNTTIATRTDGTFWGWGANGYGEIGNNSVSTRSSPTQVGTLTDWSKISIGSGHSMAIKTDGSLWVWGASNNGQIGDGTLVSKSSPIQLGTATDWYTVSAGLSHSMAIKNLGH